MSYLTDELDGALAAPGPARVTGSLRLGEMPGGSRIDVPFTVLRGAQPGPTVWMMAARDGDEVHATLIAMELQRRLQPDGIAGTVVVLPIGNVPGFGVLSREHPLAPTYLEQQMDDRFFEVIAERGDSFVDLHSAGVPSDTVDWTLFVEGDDTGAAMARAAPRTRGGRAAGPARGCTARDRSRPRRRCCCSTARSAKAEGRGPG